MTITVFHSNDAPDTTAALDAAGYPWIDYNVGRGVAEVNWAVACHLRDIGAVAPDGWLNTPVTTIFDERTRVVVTGDSPQCVLDFIRTDFLGVTP